MPTGTDCLPGACDGGYVRRVPFSDCPVARWARPWGSNMGVFAELSGITGVEKLIKFKQKILLNAAREQGHIADEHFKLVEGGACAAYVMAWFAQQFHIATHFHRAKGIASRDDEASISTAAMFVQLPGFLHEGPAPGLRIRIGARQTV